MLTQFHRPETGTKASLKIRRRLRSKRNVRLSPFLCRNEWPCCFQVCKWNRVETRCKDLSSNDPVFASSGERDGDHCFGCVSSLSPDRAYTVNWPWVSTAKLTPWGQNISFEFTVQICLMVLQKRILNSCKNHFSGTSRETPEMYQVCRWLRSTSCKFVQWYLKSSHCALTPQQFCSIRYHAILQATHDHIRNISCVKTRTAIAWWS